jgi:hypothetical protein
MFTQNHAQHHALTLVPAQGEAIPLAELEAEALLAVARAAEQGLRSLSGSPSAWKRFLVTVRDQALTASPSAAPRLRPVPPPGPR